MTWQQWLAAEWPCLRAHGRSCVPAELGHPREAGFAPAVIAEQQGQVGDWVLPLSDGSRLHVHEYPDGALVAHVDAIDPGRGVGAALRHVATETTLGRLVVVQGFGALLGVGWLRWYAKR
jgi:hypothetical protein